MIEFIGDALTSILGGGATGLIGSGITLFMEFKKQKLSNEHERDMAELSLQRDEASWEYQLKGITTQAQADIDRLDAGNFGKAIEADKATYSNGKTGFMGALLGAVDVFRGLIRPTVTVWFCYLSYSIYEDMHAKIAALNIPDGNVSDILALHQNITLVLLYLTCTAVTYWFGTRIKTQKPISNLFGESR